MSSGYTLAELKAHLGGEALGDTSRRYSGVASLEHADEHQISFLVSDKHLAAARASKAGALLVPAALAERISQPRLIVANPHAAFARAIGLYHPEPVAAPGIHPSASIAEGADIAVDAHIGAHAVIGERARIGPQSRIDAGCVIGPGVTIGANCRLHANVTLYAGCRIGDRVILHSGCVIGADGFGLAWEDDHWLKVPQVGSVVLEDDVEIGANTTVDRGALDDTVIERGAKLDNLIQVAHNVRIGAHTAIAACVGIAGSTRIGAYCQIGGAAMIIGHLEIADRVTISAGTFVGKSIREPGTYTSVQPFMAHADWKRNAAHLRHLDHMHERLKQLEKILSELERKSP
ncbi:MAG: UDP-3-O-(3-hydroxymyristoyl)glucosamine N-acyltransferase [Hydrogenophilaceae bacterium]|nr:UDP-3-O-(3-hydroxymyristoyl)glucosamine N-acyltransferase [Hydrogenophilaceae bacterium]